MGNNSPMKSTKKLFLIVEELRERNGAGVTELADTLDIPKATVHRHLHTLEELEYVIKSGNTYRIGAKFLHIGSAARSREDAYIQIKTKLEKLATDTGERAQFMIEEHGYMIYIHRETGESAVRTNTQLGKQMPIHATSGGKAILSEMPDERVEDILQRHGLPRVTENTITEKSELYDELQQIRNEGISYNDQEYIDGLRAIAVPITLSDGKVLGAIGLSGPSHRFKGELYQQELPDKLLGVANEIELNLRYS